MNFSETFLNETKRITELLDVTNIERAIQILVATRQAGGRLFILGSGGSAANASHAVNDFRKITGIETYAPTDNVAELTARINDDGWSSIFTEWLKVSKLTANDTVLILSVGGGNLEKNVSPNLVTALQFAKKNNSKVIGIVSRDGGFTAQIADACILIPVVNTMNTTPHAESFQSIILHLIVSHPALKIAQTKWESIK